MLLYGLTAVAAERTPADFGSGEKRLDNLIKFPEIATKVDKEFVCQGILKASGRLSERACFLVESRDTPYLEAIDKAGKKAHFTPAAVDGQKIGIYFMYRVRFTRDDESQQIVLYANQAYPENLSAYGPDHIAAQRSVTREQWQKACPTRTRFIVLARAHIAASGEQSSINVTHGSGLPISDTCRAAIVETLEQSVFIPAYADGEPVPSSYLEAFGS
jgi:hypothetical protein